MTTTDPYRSGLERRIAQDLKTLGVPFEYEPVRIAYQIQATYKPDFVLPNGIHLEAKGIFDPADRRKMVAVKKDNPDLDIRFILQTPYKTLSKNSLTSYADWCTKHGFPWCRYPNIPIDWLT